MDMTVSPVAAFGLAGGSQFSTTLTGQWNGQIFSGVCPANTIPITYIGPVTLLVSGAKDASGNPMSTIPPNATPGPSSAYQFTIAGLPYVQGTTITSQGKVVFADGWAPYSGIGYNLVPAKPIISSNDPANFGGIHLDIRFSQPMNTTAVPTVTANFSNGNIKPLPAGSWSMNRETYSIDTPSNFITTQEAGNSVTLSISGGRDAADNRPQDGDPETVDHLDITGKHWGHYTSNQSN